MRAPEARLGRGIEKGLEAEEAEGEVLPTALIVVVDLDDDVAEVGYTTPILGEENVLRAAIDFAIAKPEDSDSNAMFAGIQLYRRLVSAGHPAEIVVVSGSREDAVEAQLRVKRQVEEVVKHIGGDVELYLVSDGEDDLMVTEILSSVAPIAAVRRVIVEQHLGIEGGVILLAKYLKKALVDARFSRYTLGVPGLIVSTWALLSLAGYADVVYRATMLIIGLFMVIKGFSLEGKIVEVVEDILGRPPLVLAGTLVFAMFALASAASAYYASNESTALSALASIMETSIPLFAAGMISYVIIARLMYKITRGDLGVTGEAAFIVLATFMSIAFYKLGGAVRSIAETADSEAVVSAILGSGFVETSVIGAGLAGIIELAGKYAARRQEAVSGG